MQHKPSINDLIVKLEACFRDAGLTPELRRSTTGAVIAARTTIDDEEIRVLAQVQIGEPAQAAGHGLVARDLAAQHRVRAVIRPSLEQRAAAGPSPAKAVLSHVPGKPEKPEG